MGKANLKERVFNIADGDLYLILVFIRQEPKVVTHMLKNEIITSTVYQEAKVWKSKINAQDALTELNAQEFKGTVLQVKNLLKPMYYVTPVEYNKFFDELGLDIIVAGHEWKPLDTPTGNGYYDDYNQAANQLIIYKQDYITKVHKKIMKLKDIVLTKL
jgi:hypothetical protein